MIFQIVAAADQVTPVAYTAVPGLTDDLQVTDDPLKVASGAALGVLTEWPEFRLLAARHRLRAVRRKTGRSKPRASGAPIPRASQALPELHADRASWGDVV